ncbi:hypothetical protein [Companilactobacillus zhachilii]|jgi:hypothetical protein|uniref:Uncharacterized protein n=1 Tax=Companilactobacillus zhachilii TaxID=2304606 RepID=A0A386PRR6_9LACO|nr:hypothetical protein [Companilactobacillus zhachilii]AYE38072.1 hypothetical protein D1B17_05270 [Companilactobacillus zhachilii]MBL3530242.1 hypothetical protein [Companilactobacillus zhachilii]
MAFQLWYTNYFVDIASDEVVDPKTLKGISDLGQVSANGNLSAWHVKSQLQEEDFKRHLNQLLSEQTKINPDDVVVTKGINGGPLSML